MVVEVVVEVVEVVVEGIPPNARTCSRTAWLYPAPSGSRGSLTGEPSSRTERPVTGGRPSELVGHEPQIPGDRLAVLVGDVGTDWAALGPGDDWGRPP